MKRRRQAPPLPREHRDKTRTWRTADVLGQVEWLEQAAGYLGEDCVTVIRRAVLDHDDGTGGGGDVKVSGGRVEEDGSETGRIPSMAIRHAEGKDDRVALAAATLMVNIAGMRRAMHAALGAAAELKGLDPVLARKLVEEKKPGRAGADHCANPHCGRWVPGTRDDRLRGGRCDSCRKYLVANGVERPAELCHPGSSSAPPAVDVLAEPSSEFWRDLHAVEAT